MQLIFLQVQLSVLILNHTHIFLFSVHAPEEKNENWYPGKEYDIRKECKEYMVKNGDIEMRVSWLDAAADFRVQGQPIIGKTMAFEHEGFIRDYEVVKHEKPEMAG